MPPQELNKTTEICNGRVMWEKWNQSDFKRFCLTDPTKSRINATLQNFVGTKNYHNFTTGRNPKDQSNIRFIMKFEIDNVFKYNDVEFVRIVVHGQSFMLHQVCVDYFLSLLEQLISSPPFRGKFR